MPKHRGAWKKLQILGKETLQSGLVEALASRLDVNVAETIGELDRLEQTSNNASNYQLCLSFETRFYECVHKDQVRLASLSIFPDLFTAVQARSICSVTRRSLQYFTSRKLLEGTGSRFAIIPESREFLRAVFGQSNPGIMSVAWRRMEDRYQRYFVRWLLPSNCVQHIVSAEAAHLRQALEVIVARDRCSLDCVLFLGLLRFFRVEDCVAIGQIWCERIALNTAASQDVRRSALQLSGQICISQREFEKARAFLVLAQSMFSQDELHQANDVAYNLALACHHMGDSVAAVRYARQSIQFAERINDYAKASGLLFLAEIYRADAKYELAYTVARRSVELRLSASSEPLGVAEALYQLAAIEQQLNKLEDALLHYEGSLRIRLDHEDLNGQADCLRGIAALLLIRGAVAQSEVNLRYALNLYRNNGNSAGEAAALAVLGDLFSSEGRVDEARIQYETGLAFWTAENNLRWIKEFEERISRLPG